MRTKRKRLNFRVEMLHKLLVTLALVAGLCASAFKSTAQGKQSDSRLALTVLTAYYNSGKFDSAYELLSYNFKKQIPAKDFVGFMTDVYGKQGAITHTSFKTSAQGTDVYNAYYKKDSSGATITLAVDSVGKIGYLLFSPSKGGGTTSKNLRQIVDSVTKRYVTRVNTVGLAVGVIRGDTVDKFYYGETAKGSQTMPDDHTLFEIGSVSKTFTALLAAYYSVERKLDLKAPISKYLPASVAANKHLKAITMEMLLTHTAGMPRLPSDFERYATDSLNPYKYYDKSKLLANLASFVPDTLSGSKFLYSNMGMAVAGLVLEQVSGMSYEKMVRQVICQPLGMTETMHLLDEASKKRFAPVYDEQGEPTSAWDFEAFAAAGALRSSNADMLKYLKANLKPPKGKLGSAIALTQQVYAKNIEAGGLGWFLAVADETATTFVYWHNGGTGGSHTFAAYSPQRKLGVVVLSNAAEDADFVGGGILNRLMGR
jgi:CubicO group peptidase (beta-lactamase class C family)